MTSCVLFFFFSFRSFAYLHFVVAIVMHLFINTQLHGPKKLYIEMPMFLVVFCFVFLIFMAFHVFYDVPS